MKIIEASLKRGSDHQVLTVSLMFALTVDLGVVSKALVDALRVGSDVPELLIADGSQQISRDTAQSEAVEETREGDNPHHGHGEAHLAEDRPNPEDNLDTPAGMSAANAPPLVTRRRRVNPLDVVTDQSGAAPGAQANPTATDATPASSRRRRSGVEPAVTSEATPATEDPGASRRRRVPPQETPTTAASTAKSPSEGEPGSEISDADLSKAASGAARVLLPVGVKAVLTKLGVASTNELKGQSRRDFINTLKAEVAKSGRGEK